MESRTVVVGSLVVASLVLGSVRVGDGATVDVMTEIVGSTVEVGDGVVAVSVGVGSEQAASNIAATATIRNEALL